MYVHIDSLIGVREEGRFLGDLKDRAFKGDRIVFSYGAPILKTQSLFDLKGTDFSPGRQSVSRRLGESTGYARAGNVQGLFVPGVWFWLWPFLTH